MSAGLISLDTNILVYAIDLDAGPRHQKSVGLFKHLPLSRCVLTLQALSEFFTVATRKKRMPIEDAIALIEDWQTLFPVVEARSSTLNRAMNAVARHQLSFWDAMLWATLRDHGVETLLSEDFQGGATVEGIQIINPFAQVDFSYLTS